MYLCIDLKSFYASAECARLGVDPFKVNLVVADKSRGQGALCLAVSPAMKALGVKNRCRLFEIPPTVDYIAVRPHMRYYMEISAAIYKVYLSYLAKEDLYPYSIDECFISIAPYRQLYGNDPKALARKLMNAVYDATKISSAAGIGTNLYLAKIALDITAKHARDRIGFLDEALYKKTLWHHQPLTDFWQIGPGIQRRLAALAIHDMKGITSVSEELLYHTFGIQAELLIDHAWGREPCTIADIRAVRPSSSSLSSSQVLFEDYGRSDARLIVTEMTETLLLELLSKKLAASGISIRIGYSGRVHPHTSGSLRFAAPTDLPSSIKQAMLSLYDKKAKDLPIRTIGIRFDRVVPADAIPRQGNLFISEAAAKKEKALAASLLAIRREFGKNAILKGTSLLKKSTIRKRNTLIGGHHA